MHGETPPVPDPTILTTEALLREVARVKELVDAMLDGIGHVIDEKFSSVDRQLALVEQQRVEQKQDTKAAVDAALTAQKEAVKEQTTASERAIAKSEAATTKSIEQLGSTFTTAFDGQRRDIDDLKERITGVEQQKKGGQEAAGTRGDFQARLIAGISALVALGALIFTAVH